MIHKVFYVIEYEDGVWTFYDSYKEALEKYKRASDRVALHRIEADIDENKEKPLEDMENEKWKCLRRKT